MKRPLMLATATSLFFSLACLGGGDGDLSDAVKKVGEAAEQAAQEAEKAAEQAKKAANQAGEAAKEVDVQQGLEGGLKGLEGGLKGLEGALKGLGATTGSVDPADFRLLKELLRESVAGLKREKFSGEKTSMAGVGVSTAKASYGTGEPRLEIEIVDMGGMAGMVRAASVAWSTVEIDKESDDGYERTSMHDGHKAFERYNTSSENGESNVFVEGRFVVNVKGYGVTPEQLAAGRDSVPYDKLAEIAKKDQAAAEKAAADNAAADQ